MPEPCQTLIRAAVILTQDERRTRYYDAGLAINEGRILALGAWDELNTRFSPLQTLDYRDCLLLPGLINAHTHAAMTVFRGAADDLPLEAWLQTRIWPLERALNPRMVQLGSLLACAEMLRFGVTCFADMYLFEEEAADVVEQSGIRAVLAEGLLAFPTPSYATPEQGLEKAERLFDRVKGHPRLRAAMAPHSLYATTPEQLQKSFAFAERHDAPWMLHLAETPTETADWVKRTGQRPLGSLDQAGMLDARTVLIHAVDLTPKEIKRVAAVGAKVAHIPKSNMKLASGAALVPTMLKLGVRVCLGADGAASNNTLNIFSEMNFCALLHKLARHNAATLPAQTVLDMATRDGADCLGWPELGRLAPGLPADLLALDLTAPNLTPVYDEVSHAVYAATGAEVRLTMVGGDILYQDGRFLTIDIDSLRQEVQALARGLRGTYA